MPVGEVEEEEDSFNSHPKNASMGKKLFLEKNPKMYNGIKELFAEVKTRHVDEEGKMSGKICKPHLQLRR